jgi:predicted phage tail protein
MAPASTTVAAVATDANGSVARVDFYAGSTLLGSDTTSPYSVNWSNVPAGSYLLTARATDNTGASTMSAGVNVTVNANQAPTVSLTSPATGTIFSTPATVTMTASANDADGSIQKVEFYNGSTLLGSDTTSPFTFSWSNVPAGAYSLSAVAHDNLGASTVSSWSDITVGAATVLSTAIFAPAVVPDAIDFYVFEVFAAGSDPLVAAPVASQNLGVPTPINGEIVANVGSTISALAPGSYIATVSSFSAGEGVLRSSPFAFTR